MTVVYPSWVWLTEPEHNFLTASYSLDLSTEHSVTPTHYCSRHGSNGFSAIADILGGFFQSVQKLCPPVWPFSSSRQVAIQVDALQPCFKRLTQLLERKPHFHRSV